MYLSYRSVMRTQNVPATSYIHLDTGTNDSLSETFRTMVVMKKKQGKMSNVF